MSEKSLVSYVIGVRNMEDTVGKTIESILNQDYQNKEIIVINDGSDDNTEDVLKKYPIKFINTEKIGISNARNLGYQNSKGDFVAFTDADCELDPSWTINMLKCFNDEEVGLVGGVTHFKTDGTYCSIYRSLEFSKRYKNIKSKEVFHAGGPGFIFRKSVIDEIGGFDPKWVHGEDVEISFLAIKHGYKVIKEDSAISYHIPENNFRRIVKKGLRDARAYIRVAKNHTLYSLKNKFHHTWYFKYDLMVLPALYLFILFSIILLPIFYILFIKILLYTSLITLFSIWSWLLIFSLTLVFIYSLIPAFQVFIKSKKVKKFFGTFLLHHTRGFAWGIGLLLGILDLILKKQ